VRSPLANEQCTLAWSDLGYAQVAKEGALHSEKNVSRHPDHRAIPAGRSSEHRMTPSVFTFEETVGRAAVISRKQQPVILRYPLSAQNIPF